MSRALRTVLLLLLAAACTRAPREEAHAGAPVILVSIDTLRADHLPAYGYSAVATPAIDALRRDAILYTHAYSHCPLTLPSHVSMLTGLLPTEHHVRNNAGYTYDAAKHASIAQLLHARGYETGGAVSSYVLRRETGFGAMFDWFDDAIPVSGGAVSFVQHQRSGAETTAAALRWLEPRRERPFFLFLHLYEPHTPYDPPEPFRSRYASRYDGEIARADQIVGDFLARLQALGVYDRALIIFTSDHGEGLGDHGEDQHGILLYRETIQVPLMIKLPGAARRGETVAAPAAHIDLAPTIARLMGIETPKEMRGASLLSLPSSRAIYSETYFPLINLGWSPLRSLRTEKFTYIDAPPPELYDITRDPAERNDVLVSERRAAASLRETLAQYPSTLDTVAQVDPEEAKRLAALGYIGSVQNRAAAGPLPNPRDAVRVLPRIAEAFRLADERDYAKAVPMMRELVRENPRLVDVWEKLGQTLADAGRVDEAIAAYQEAVRQSGGAAVALAVAAGDLYLRKGSLQEAEQLALVGLRLEPREAHELLAKIATKRGDFATAAREIDDANKAGTPQPSTLLLRAEIEVQQGALQQALASVDAAEQRAKEMGAAHLFRANYVRGDALARMNRADEAEAAYRREIANFPNDIDAYANLAILRLVRG
ncbi:MAG TPA: sulfatase-like hydrolase/transferase, partial [Thermoanaerobaculia bacterium]|nr:sulfatase-like hydrolase/transferase [Thermoanaerobaculia bacterium]